MRLLALAVLPLLVPVAPAGAEPAPAGKPCHIVVLHEPAVAPAEWQGVLSGGPVAAPGAVVSVECTVVDAATDEVLATASSGPAAGAAALAETVAYRYDVVALDLVCTAVTVDGAPWTWDAGAWVPGPARCTPLGPLVSTDQCLSEECGPLWVVYRVVDPLLCAVLADVPDVPGVLATGDDGDVDVAGEPFWLCPPY